MSVPVRLPSPGGKSSLGPDEGGREAAEHDMGSASQPDDFSDALTDRLKKTAEDAACSTLPDSQPQPRQGSLEPGQLQSQPSEPHLQYSSGSPRTQQGSPHRRAPAPSFSAWSDPDARQAIAQASQNADSGSHSPGQDPLESGNSTDQPRHSVQDRLPELNWSPTSRRAESASQPPDQPASPSARWSPFQDLHMDPVRPGRGRVSHEIPHDLAERWSSRMGLPEASNGSASASGSSSPEQGRSRPKHAKRPPKRISEREAEGNSDR